MPQPTLRTGRRRALLAAALALFPWLPSRLDARTGDPVVPARSVAVSPARLASAVDSLARAAVAETGGGVSVAIVLGDSVILARGYGVADAGAGVAAGPETVYRAGSIAKQFTAAALLRLAEAGRLSLDDPLSKHLPDFPLRGRAVTLRQLLSHTSGLRGYTSAPEFRRAEREDVPREWMLSLLGRRGFEFAPGEAWSYSNTGYYLLALVVERASGMAYAEYVRAELARPLGLPSTADCGDAVVSVDPSRRAAGYTFAEGRLREADPISPAATLGAGSLCASAPDLARWARALATGRVVGLDAYREMTTEGRLSDGTRLGYGLGQFVGTLDGVRRVQHGGTMNGFQAQLAYYPEAGLAIAVLANHDAARPEPLERAIARLALGAREPPARDLPLPHRDAARYTGVYDMGGRRLRITEAREGLRMELDGELPFTLRYRGEDAFAIPLPMETLWVRFRVVDGAARSFVLEQRGVLSPARRIG
ncbi:MAG TPA: serine hydrolase domain-containing protein [Longimicrobium sp.]|nr:serine hydrolase domain-containing protein [Longimicrobium sp.]